MLIKGLLMTCFLCATKVVEIYDGRCYIYRCPSCEHEEKSWVPKPEYRDDGMAERKKSLSFSN
jgi:uncharacterized Zn finger protein (UPF0148 family)